MKSRDSPNSRNPFGGPLEPPHQCCRWQGRKEKKMNEQISSCTWAGCYDIDGKYQDDGKTRACVVAVFRFPFEAQDFIEKCLPKNGRFYVKNTQPA